MFYQSEFSVTAVTFQHESGYDIRFPMHLHENFEIITVTEGDVSVTVGDRVYTVTPGSAVLVFPNQPHELDTPIHSRYELWIFSSKHVQAYAQAYADKIPESNLFSLHSFYLDRLLKLQAGDSSWKFKGVLYSVCSSFDETAKYRPISESGNQLLLRIFNYVRIHYAGDCSLDGLSKNLGFNAAYLSRYFKEHTGVPYTEYVIYHRLREVCYLLLNTRDSILSAAMSCGFGSVCSFNRCFRKYYGMTPREYREQAAKRQPMY